VAIVADLMPGDLVTLGPGSGVFVTSCRHPLYPMLQLVIWRLPDRSWSLDALHMQQHVGDLSPASSAERVTRLRDALAG